MSYPARAEGLVNMNIPQIGCRGCVIDVLVYSIHWLSGYVSMWPRGINAHPSTVVARELGVASAIVGLRRLHVAERGTDPTSHPG